LDKSLLPIIEAKGRPPRTKRALERSVRAARVTYQLKEKSLVGGGVGWEGERERTGTGTGTVTLPPLDRERTGRICAGVPFSRSFTNPPVLSMVLTVMPWRKERFPCHLNREQ